MSIRVKYRDAVTEWTKEFTDDIEREMNDAISELEEIDGDMPMSKVFEHIESSLAILHNLVDKL